MLILPLKFIREEDKRLIGVNLYHLGKLSHFGLPVIESAVAIPSSNIFENAVSKYLKNHPNLKDHLNNIKNELLNIPIPQSLESFELINILAEKTKPAINIKKLWEDLLQKWTSEILSKIERGEKNIFNLTPQLVVFSADFSVFGRGFFDEDRGHVVIKIDQGQLNFQTSSEIENLVLLGNKKLLLPQVYYWAVENNKIKIVKVVPFTQSLNEEKERPEKIVSAVENLKPIIKTATKIFLDYRGEVLTDYNGDGFILNITKLDEEIINENINKVLKFDPAVKIIFNPDIKLSYEKTLEFAKIFLFFRNKKKLDTQIVLPEVFSVDEFLNLKREYASLGIYSKGSVKIWKQFNTVADFLNIDDYLDAGFDGAVVDLDKIARIVCGVDGETVISDPQIDRIEALEKFFKELGLSKIVKNLKPVLLKGKLSQNEELLNYFIKSGVWGIAFENNVAENFREHISFLERQAVKKLPRIEIQH